MVPVLNLRRSGGNQKLPYRIRNDVGHVIQLGCGVFSTGIVWCVHTLYIHISSVADPDKCFHFDAVPYPDPAPPQSGKSATVLLVYRPSTAPFRASRAPLRARTALHGLYFEPVDANPDPDLAYQNDADPDPLHCIALIALHKP